MNAAASNSIAEPDPMVRTRAGAGRVASVDALRGIVMFTMIFVNDLAGVPDTIVPGWMKHFHGRSGMTFVDLVFPAFLFIVGLSLPLALLTRESKGEPIWKTTAHLLLRTLCLLCIGILMVNETPDSVKLGWSGTLWTMLMYLSSILAFCSVSPVRHREPAPNSARFWRLGSLILRLIGWAGLAFLALAFRGRDGHRIISFAPFAIEHQWYGILGLIGWAYLVGGLVYLIFGANRTALLGCVVLLMCLYPADHAGLFKGWWVAKHVGIGGTLGSQAAITVAGLLLATVFAGPENAPGARFKFAGLFIVSFSSAALLLNDLYGINKNQATPSWCLWACAITATLWLLLHWLADGRPGSAGIRVLTIAGQNVFLAYLLSEMLPSVIDLAGLNDWYAALATPHLWNAILRSAGCAAAILAATGALNAMGVRLRL